jgi:hypothetical protein
VHEKISIHNFVAQVLDHPSWKVGLDVRVAHLPQAQLPSFVISRDQAPLAGTGAGPGPLDTQGVSSSECHTSPNKRKLDGDGRLPDSEQRHLKAGPVNGEFVHAAGSTGKAPSALH